MRDYSYGVPTDPISGGAKRVLSHRSESSFDPVVFMGAPDSARELVRLGWEAVERAGRDDASLFDRSYRDLIVDMHRLANEVPEHWAFVCAAAITVWHPNIEFEALTHGSAHRRINAVYELLEVGFAAHEVQAAYLEHVEAVREASKSDAVRLGLQAAKYGGVVAGGWLGFGGAPAGMATDWLNGVVAPPTQLTFDLAAVALFWKGLIDPDVDTPEDVLRAVRIRCRDQLDTIGQCIASASRGSTDQSSWNMWRFLVQLAAGDIAGCTMPNLIGHPFSNAKHQITALGLEFKYLDALQDPGGAGRPVVVERNWKVVGQHPPPLTPLDLGLVVGVAVARYDDQAAGSTSPEVMAHFAVNA